MNRTAAARCAPARTCPARGFAVHTGLAILFIVTPPGALGQTPTEAQGGVPVRASEAQGGSPGYRHELAPRARAIPASGEISLDGRLSEAVWNEAPAITDFIQQDPAEGEPATQRTEFRVAYDDVAIYIGAMLYDTQAVTTRRARRDPQRTDFDFIQVGLDSYHDHQTVYRFSVNPSGTKHDAVAGRGRGGGPGGGGGGDDSWDPVWDVATEIGESGWSAEMRIPFSQLRFRPDEEQTWGIDFRRNTHRTQELVTFPFVPTLEQGGASRFAHLDGIAGVEPGRRLEVMPYLAGRAEYLKPTDPPGITFNNPFRSGSDQFAAVGADFKYRLTSNLTVDATVNPDFGQVELDPSVINLTAYETRYQERRPFFVEGADVFRFGEGGPGGGGTVPAPQLLYSRRIGRPPTGAVPADAVYSDAAPWTTILGAAKVTGQVGDGWSLGIIEAVTAQEVAPYVDSDQRADEAVVEPRTNYLAGRLRRQLRGGDTRFGVMATAVHRNLAETALADRLRSGAYAGGVDFGHEWANRTYQVTGTFQVSHIEGDAGAIRRTQESSARYFQRPDADHLELDPTRSSLSGYYAGATAAKQAGAFGARIAAAAISPGYEVNDLGFQPAADRLVIDTNLSYNQPNPGRLLRQWNVRGSPDAMWNFGGERIFAQVNGNFGWELLNYWGGQVRLVYTPPHADDRLTRGGPLARTVAAYGGWVNLNSDTRRSVVGQVSWEWATDEADSWSHRINTSVSVSASEALEFRLGPTLDWRYESAQFLTSVEDPLATRTFGRRYIFGALDQTTISMEARVNVTFTPELSLQLYLEPFISTGDYDRLMEFERPNAYRFLEYGTDTGTISAAGDGGFNIDPDGAGAPGSDDAAQFHVPDEDFSYRSLLGNLVLRWEWRQGSTLFLVWQQRRVDARTGHGTGGADPWVGGFDLGRDVDHMFSTRPDNIFVLKASYWLNP